MNIIQKPKSHTSITVPSIVFYVNLRFTVLLLLMFFRLRFIFLILKFHISLLLLKRLKAFPEVCILFAARPHLLFSVF